MDLVEHLRHTLDFVHDHPAFVTLRDLVAEPLRRGQQLRIRLVIEQIEERRVGKLFVRPGGLAHAARSEQEEAPPGGRPEPSWIHESFIT
jgi:hypothetical protein